MSTSRGRTDDTLPAYFASAGEGLPLQQRQQLQQQIAQQLHVLERQGINSNMIIEQYNQVQDPNSQYNIAMRQASTYMQQLQGRGLIPRRFEAALGSLFAPKSTIPLAPVAETCIAHLRLLHAFHSLKEDIGYSDGLFGLWDSAVRMEANSSVMN